MNTDGELFPWESQHHPGERVLQMTKEDLLALPAAISHFNGFHTESGGFVFVNPIRMLIAWGVAVALVLTAIAVAAVRWFRHRRRTA